MHLRAIADALQGRYDYQRRPLLVGVFVNQSAAEIVEIVEGSSIRQNQKFRRRASMGETCGSSQPCAPTAEWSST